MGTARHHTLHIGECGGCYVSRLPIANNPTCLGILARIAGVRPSGVGKDNRKLGGASGRAHLAARRSGLRTTQWDISKGKEVAYIEFFFRGVYLCECQCAPVA